MESYNWVSICWVGSEQEQYVCVRYLTYGIGHRTTAKACGQTGHSWGVSGAGTHIHAVGSHHSAGELHHQVVFFVGAPGGTNAGYALWAMF